MKTSPINTSLTHLPQGAFNDFFKILGAFLFSRLWTALFVYIGNAHAPVRIQDSQTWMGVSQAWLNPWTLYDTEWYLKIARSGYDAVSTVFFPLYPALLSLAGPGDIGMSFWGVILSQIFFLGGLYYLYRLTVLDFGEGVARTAVFLLAFFPTTAFFSAVYTESLFLFLSVSAFYYVRKGGWGRAGLLAGLAGLTRNSGWILWIMLVVEYFQYIRREKKPVKGLDLLAVSLPLAAFAGVMIYFGVRFGALGVGVESQQYFFRSWAWPWTPVLKDLFISVPFFMSSGLDLFITLLNWVAIFWVIGLLVQYRKATPISYAVYLLCILMMHLCNARIVPPYTIGSVRYLASTFPFIQLFAKSTEKIQWATSLKFLALLFYLFISAALSYLFGFKLFLG